MVSSIKEGPRQTPFLGLAEGQFLQWLTIQGKVEADAYSSYRQFLGYSAEVLESWINGL